MHCGQDIAAETPSGLGRARRVLREQLEALVRLAAIAMRMAETVAQAAADPGKVLASPLAGVFAVERAVRGYARVSWALRLIAALRAKLLDDLQRVERGEAVNVTPKAETPRPLAAQAEAGRHNQPETEPALETERGETEGFGRFLSRRHGDGEFAEILKRPTEEVIALIREALGVSDEAEREPFSPGGRRAGMRGLGPIRPRSEKTLLRVEPPETFPDSLHPHPRPFPHQQGEGGPQG